MGGLGIQVIFQPDLAICRNSWGIAGILMTGTLSPGLPPLRSPIVNLMRLDRRRSPSTRSQLASKNVSASAKALGRSSAKHSGHSCEVSSPGGRRSRCRLFVLGAGCLSEAAMATAPRLVPRGFALLSPMFLDKPTAECGKRAEIGHAVRIQEKDDEPSPLGSRARPISVLDQAWLPRTGLPRSTCRRLGPGARWSARSARTTNADEVEADSDCIWKAIPVDRERPE